MGQRVVYFIDNDSARGAAIRSYSLVLPSLEILMACIKWDFDYGSIPWYARVPTSCNAADDPSRLRVDGFVRMSEAEEVQAELSSGIK